MGFRILLFTSMRIWIGLSFNFILMENRVGISMLMEVQIRVIFNIPFFYFFILQCRKINTGTFFDFVVKQVGTGIPAGVSLLSQARVVDPYPNWIRIQQLCRSRSVLRIKNKLFR